MRAAGLALVGAQFALLGWLLWPSAPLRASVPALCLMAAALLLALWTLAHNRPGNFNIHPEPRASGRLVTSGPYRRLRHPMYAALLLLAAATALAYGDAWKWLAWGMLAMVLAAKAALEERGLKARYAEYADYARRVKAFIPGVF